MPTPTRFRKDEKQRSAQNLGWIKPATIERYAAQPGTRAHRVISAHFALTDEVARRLHEFFLFLQARDLLDSSFGRRAFR